MTWKGWRKDGRVKHMMDLDDLVKQK